MCADCRLDRLLGSVKLVGADRGSGAVHNHGLP